MPAAPAVVMRLASVSAKLSRSTPPILQDNVTVAPVPVTSNRRVSLEAHAPPEAKFV